MAARLNNEGAALLGTGDLKQARDMFRRALSSLTVSARASLVVPVKEDDTASCLSGFPIESSPLFQQKQILQQGNRSITEETTIVYKQAIPAPSLLCSTSLPGSHKDAFCQSLTSACCIFNLALVYHLRGLMQSPSSGSSNQEGGNQRQQLLKARALYEKCSGLVFLNGLGSYVGAHPIADLLSMAVLNNHAHVCHELASYDLANVDGLLYVASLVNPGYYRNQEVDTVMQRAKQTFCLNALTLQPPSAAHAA